MKTDYDIIIIGNGMVGASLANALATLDLRIAIIDKTPLNQSKTPSGKLDGRKIALSLGSYKILQQIGIWPYLTTAATMIKQVHVSQKNKFGAVLINAADMNAATLGYVVAAEAFNQAFYSALKDNTKIEWLCPAILQNIELATPANVTISQHGQEKKLTAKLIVAADGALSYSRQLLNIAVKEKDYQQTALVSSVQLTQPHHHIAYQRLTNDAVIAMLPMQKKTYGVVYTAPKQYIEQLLIHDDDTLLKQLQQQFGYRLGRLEKLGPRFTYPIKLIIATEQVKPNFLLLGNAAHNLSPIAAQGFNLALQDIYCLSHLIQRYGDDYDFILSQYQQQRQQEQQDIIAFTDRLMTWSKANIPLLKTFALLLLDLNPNMKQSFARLGMGLTPQLQSLIRDGDAQRL